MVGAGLEGRGVRHRCHEPRDAGTSRGWKRPGSRFHPGPPEGMQPHLHLGVSLVSTVQGSELQNSLDNSVSLEATGLWRR